jgi:uncharacterized protein (UPF0276 family)
MQFALNYSPQAADLLREGRIQLDRFKCPNWADLLREARAVLPVYVHFDLIAGKGGMKKVDWDGVETALKETDTPYVNLHLAPMLGELPGITSEPLTETQRQQVIEQMHTDVGYVVERFGADRVIVENIPYRKTDDPYLRRRFARPCVEPEVFNVVLTDANCGFLLDISHARISAETLGIGEKEYIESMPLRWLRELHVTGMELIEGKRQDHMAMQESDWQMFEWMIGKIAAGEAAQPWIVAFEYGGLGMNFEWRSHADVIAAQVPRLYDTVHGVRV